MNKPSLIVCIIMDIIGCLSYFIPALGEFSDAIWAPISAYVFYKMFGGKTGKIGSLIQFTEEIVPFTDFLPTFTLGYFFKKIEK
ncbi:MAG: hypothetical protein E7076_02445 [Bacteroidales bacterium]|nr:hypothetical protein [Bacteroidales bacterium]MBP5134750.1 hypothetical protein [Paludibacteraceae bacterium]MBR6311083.1 hypothetical protein [Paludibacteraceae bacterium]